PAVDQPRRFAAHDAAPDWPARRAAGLWQREGGQIQYPADRDHAGRRLYQRQQRSVDAQHVQRRPEALWSAACDDRGHRRRPDHQQKKHPRRLQNELVGWLLDTTPGRVWSERVTTLPFCPTAAAVACGNRLLLSIIRAKSCARV